MSESWRVTAPKLWIVLARCQRSMSLLVERWIADEGLSTSDFQLLETLLHKGPLTITEIQKKVLLATGSMTAAVDRVEKRGLINRTATKGDRRARRLVLTEKGRQLAESLYKVHAEQLKTAMSVLGDAETKEFHRLLKKLGLFAAEMLQQQETATNRNRWASTTSDSVPKLLNLKGEEAMKAVIVRAYGDISELHYGEMEQPKLGVGEVLVRVRATSINPLDWKMRSGAAKEEFPMHFPEILGVDLSGEVEQAGPQVEGFQKGMRVMAMGKGTYAQYVAAKAGVLAPVPDELSFERAAALPLVLTTGAQLIERAAKVQKGQTVLITGAVGSVGRVAVYVARQLGALVIAGVRASQRKEAGELGATQVVALDRAEELSQLHDVDAVADTVGGEVQKQVLSLVRDGGVYASLVGPPSQNPGRAITVQAMMVQSDAARLAELAQDVARNALVIPIAKAFPLSQVQEATRLAEDGGARGKVVLMVP